jgi:hypothetical protein
VYRLRLVFLSGADMRMVDAESQKVGSRVRAGMTMVTP